MSDLKLIPQNLKKARKKAGMTQIQAAKKAGISNHWWNWAETGKHVPSLKTLEKMCKAVNADIQDMFKPL